MSVLDRRLSFRWLLDPVTPASFLATHHGRAPLHVPGPPGKFAELFSWARLNRLLATSSTWTSSKIRLVKDREIVAPNAYCRPARDRDLGMVMRPVPTAIGKYLEQGATINVNEIQLNDERLSSIGFSLAMVFAAHVNCNLYASRRAVGAFPTHFDNSDVYVLHVEGNKRWRVYENPFEGAADIEGYTSGAHPQSYHEQRKGRAVLDLELTPGDLLYIPRGYYHDALATSEASLHLTLGVDEVRGLAVLEAVKPLLMRELVFREPLPLPDDAETHAERLRRLGTRIAEILADPAFGAHVRELQKNHAVWDMPGFSLPVPQFDEFFRVRTHAARIETRGNAAVLCFAGTEQPLEAVHAPLVAWILAADYFDTDTLVDAFPDATPETLRTLFETLVRMGVIEALAEYAC